MHSTVSACSHDFQHGVYLDPGSAPRIMAAIGDLQLHDSGFERYRLGVCASASPYGRPAYVSTGAAGDYFPELGGFSASADGFTLRAGYYQKVRSLHMQTLEALELHNSMRFVSPLCMTCVIFRHVRLAHAGCKYPVLVCSSSCSPSCDCTLLHLVYLFYLGVTHYDTVQVVCGPCGPCRRWLRHMLPLLLCVRVLVARLKNLSSFVHFY